MLGYCAIIYVRFNSMWSSISFCSYLVFHLGSCWLFYSLIPFFSLLMPLCIFVHGSLHNNVVTEAEAHACYAHTYGTHIWIDSQTQSGRNKCELWNRAASKRERKREWERWKYKKYAKHTVNRFILWKIFDEHSTYSHQIEPKLATHIFEIYQPAINFY